jgi:hypothetical protein
MKALKYWTPKTFEISSYKYSLKERINQTYLTSGGDGTGKCIYTYNELGFRGDSIKKEGFKVMCIGDSNTEGVGVNNNETWPAQFTKLIPNSVNMNFGTGGRSNDFISRCLITYYDIIKPDLVLIMYTSPHRREIYTSDCGIEPFMPTAYWGYMRETIDGKSIQQSLTQLQNDNEDFINWYKNHMLIKYFLESKKSNWLWNGWMEIPKEYVEFNRFDGDFGARFSDYGVDGLHPGPINNYEYSVKLLKYIKDKFKNYLPEGVNAFETNKLI